MHNTLICLHVGDMSEDEIVKRRKEMEAHTYAGDNDNVIVLTEKDLTRSTYRCLYRSLRY
jgi:hypothetical protein